MYSKKKRQNDGGKDPAADALSIVKTAPDWHINNLIAISLVPDGAQERKKPGGEVKLLAELRGLMARDGASGTEKKK